jgi:hypothetical protein
LRLPQQHCHSPLADVCDIPFPWAAMTVKTRYALSLTAGSSATCMAALPHHFGEKAIPAWWNHVQKELQKHQIARRTRSGGI